MIVEYTVLAGAPAASTPWPLVLTVATSAGMFEARSRLALIDSVSSAIGTAMTGRPDPSYRSLQRAAFPDVNHNPPGTPADAEGFWPNLFAEESFDA